MNSPMPPPSPSNNNREQDLSFAHEVLPELGRLAHFILRRRRAGKIAHLPAPVREQIDLMLHDGVPYAGIIARLGGAGQGLNKDNLSRWRKAQHQDWLAQRTWLAATRNSAQRSAAVKCVTLLLHDMDSDALSVACARNPNAFVRMINFSARLSEAMLAHRAKQEFGPQPSKTAASIRTNPNQSAAFRTISRIK